MYDYQREFIKFCLHKKALCFGEFTLKSGRVSPYFFNTGLFNTGEDLIKLGNFYASAIMNSNLEFEVLFGAAYKGIPLVCAATMTLSKKYQRNIPYVFNRKEAKDHGENGNLVGSDIRHKKILLIDDVITAGSAIREAVTILKKNEAQLMGVIIAVNRQERGENEISAVQEVEKQYKVPVLSIINFSNLMEYVIENTSNHRSLSKMEEYRKTYGI